MQCSRSVLRSRKVPENANVAMMYLVDLEPRKIAHKVRLVTSFYSPVHASLSSPPSPFPSYFLLNPTYD